MPTFLPRSSDCFSTLDGQTKEVCPMRKTVLVVALLAVLGAAQARFFLGFPGSSVITGGNPVPVGGIHFGT
jgi:hypothetical protein